MKTLYFNCRMGIAGDMVAGALLDLCGESKFLVDELKKLELDNYKIEVKKVDKKGVKATKFDVIIGHEHSHRHLSDINEIIDHSKLSESVKELAKKIFLNLAEAEAKVHGTTTEEVHFHEVGAIDAIIDIVSAAILLDKIAIKDIYSSSISVGRGTVECEHGTMSVPVPAVKELLKDIPTVATRIEKELATPTGAAIIKTIAKGFVDNPKMKARRKGYGAGTRELDVPNVLEVVEGEMEAMKKPGKGEEELVTLDTNIDDMNPQFYSYIIERLVKEGANEAFIQPVIMKKGRIGTLLTVICKKELQDKIIDIIFSETTTFGIRINRLDRVALEREIKQISTKYGPVNVKIGKYKDKVMSVSPEYEDCRKIAGQKKVPIKKVYDEVKRNI
jgi:uncharacterized protein (TIGR00299 family) protein